MPPQHWVPTRGRQCLHWTERSDRTSRNPEESISPTPLPTHSLDGGECAHLAELIQTSLRLLDILGPFLDQAVAVFQRLAMGL